MKLTNDFNFSSVAFDADVQRKTDYVFRSLEV